MRFVDVYPPTEIKGFPCYSVPMFSTTMVEVASGDESANQNWANALHQFRLPQAVRCHETFEALRNHWYCVGGPARLWPFRDPLDFASVPLAQANVEPTISAADQAIGEGDGATTEWQLIKTYSSGPLSYVREIQLPIVSTVVVLIGGLLPAVAVGGPYGISAEREGGVVTITPAVQDGLAITAGFLFDVPVRFEQDSTLEGIVRDIQVSGFSDLTLIERRLC